MAKDYLVKVPRKHNDVFLVRAESAEDAKMFVAQGEIVEQSLELAPPQDLSDPVFQGKWIVEELNNS